MYRTRSSRQGVSLNIWPPCGRACRRGSMPAPMTLALAALEGSRAFPITVAV